MKIKLVFYAVSKDYFGKELHLESNSLTELKQTLLKRVPESEAVLKSCKFVQGNFILKEDTFFTENQTVAVLPPSSGG